MTADKSELKMWLVVRTDLGMSPGKLAVQAMHAAATLHLELADFDPERLTAYLKEATPKICVKVSSLAELNRVAEEARKAVIPYCTIRDAGRSEVDPGTKTVCLFGPAYREELPPFLKRLQVLKETTHDG